MELRQAVDRLGESGQIGVRRLIPRHVVVRVAQPVVGGEVDRPHATAAEHGNHALRLEVGQREDDRVGDLGEPPGVEVVEGELGQPPQMRIRAGERLASEPVGGYTGNSDLGVARQEPQKLGPHVAARACNGNAYHVTPPGH